MISVIVPVYNTKEYLERCVNSLLKQTYQDMEIILVDDGSTDGSGEICDRFAEQDRRVRVLHKENGGSSSARNLGIENAEGDYIGFVDSDDYVDADMYERLYAAVYEHHVKAAQIGRDEIDPDGNILPDICIPPERSQCIAPEKFMEELLMHRGDCSFCTKLISREMFLGEESGHMAGKGSMGRDGRGAKEKAAGEKNDGEKAVGAKTAGVKERSRTENRFPLGVLNEDFHLLIQMLDRIGPIVSLPGHAYHVFYRLGSNSRKESRENFSRVFADCVDNADLAAEIVRRKYPGLEAAAFRFGIFQRLEYMLHIPIAQMNGENEMYREIVSYLRRNWMKTMRNPLLTGKNKVYHTLFALAPREVRMIHRRLRRL